MIKVNDLKFSLNNLSLKGLEPLTVRLSSVYSNQLSYGSIRDSLEPQLATPLFCEKVEEKRRISEQERGGNKCSSDVVNSDYKVYFGLATQT